MDKEKALPQRKHTRLQNFDYSTTGAYFITICTEGRRRTLSKIVGVDGLAAARSRSGSDTTPWCHSPPSRRLRYPGDPHTEHTEERGASPQIVGVDVLGDPHTVQLLPYGEIADKYIKQLDEFYDHIFVDQYVIMPNHIHILLQVVSKDTDAKNGGSPRTSTPTTRQTSAVSHFVSTFKRFCNKECGENIWQRGFYDHVIRDRADYEKRVKYIDENPIRWYYDELFVEE